MRSIRAFITLKIAVFAPIPRARVRMAVEVMIGFFSNWRKANLRSFMRVESQSSVVSRSSRRKEAPDNDEFQMTTDERMSKHQCADRSGGFVIKISDFFRHWDFVIRHSLI